MMNNYICLALFVLVLCRFFRFLRKILVLNFITDNKIDASDVAKKLYDDLMRHYDKRVNT
jgi:hypothetical protein